MAYGDLTLPSGRLRNRGSNTEWDWFAETDDPQLPAALAPTNTNRFLGRCAFYRGNPPLTATTSRQVNIDFEQSASASRGTGDDLTAAFEQNGGVIITLSDGKVLTLGSPAAAGDTTDHYSWTVDADETEFDYEDFDAVYDALRASVTAGTPLSGTMRIHDGADPTGPPSVTAPAKPTGFSVTAIGQAFRLQASVDNGGSAVTKWQYKIATTSAGLSSASWVDISSTSDDLDFTTGNIGYSTTRHFQVRAVNAQGNGAASDTDSATTGAAPLAVPGAVRNLAESSKTHNRITWGWDAPNTGGASASYEYRTKLSSAASFSGAWTSVGSTREAVVTGLSASTAYDIQVRARNATGTGTAATDSATTNAAPDTTAPTVSTRTVDRTSLVITCSEALDTNSVPAASAFAVQVAGAARTVSAVAIAGSAITLALASAVTAGQTVTVAYTKPSSNPVQDAAGNDLATFAAASVTNNTSSSLLPFTARANYISPREWIGFQAIPANLLAGNVDSARNFTVSLVGGPRTRRVRLDVWPTDIGVDFLSSILDEARVVLTGSDGTVLYSGPFVDVDTTDPYDFSISSDIYDAANALRDGSYIDLLLEEGAHRIDESITIIETLASHLTHGRAVVETVTIREADPRRASTPRQEQVSVAEAHRRAVAHNTAENIAVSEAMARMHRRSDAEAISLVDEHSSQPILFSTASETIRVSDSRGAPTVVKAVAEMLTLAEARAGAVARRGSEAITVTEDASSTTFLVNRIAERISVSEESVTAFKIFSAATERISVSDAAAGFARYVHFEFIRIAEDAPPLRVDIPEPPVAPQYPVIDIAARQELLLPQYASSSKLQALVRGMIGIIQSEIVNPLKLLERAMNPDESEGILLDWLGERIGMPRPFVRSSDIGYFGFEGTEDAVGKTFGNAPFFTVQALVEDVEPLGDAYYRLFLKARARRLRGGANRETIESVLAILFGNGYLDESVTPMRLVVVTDNTQVYGLVSGSEFGRVIPRPAGRGMVMARG